MFVPFYVDMNTAGVMAAVLEMQPQGEAEVEAEWFEEGTTPEESP